MSSEVEVAAREMGWRPKEEFRGDTEKWVDAETFVSRGENFIPILRKDRETLRAKTAELEGQVRETNRLLAASQEAIVELKKFHDESTAKQVEKAKRDLVRQLKEAREAGNTEQEVAIQDELAEIREAQKAPTTPASAPAAPAAPATSAPPNEHFKAWESDNPWFKDNPRKRGLALGIAQEIRDSPATKHLTGKAFFEKLDEELERETGSRSTSKVDGGRPTGGAGGSGNGSDRSYADLPAEAKAACDQQARRLVGPGRAFKDDAAWRSYYAKEFFQGADA